MKPSRASRLGLIPPRRVRHSGAWPVLWLGLLSASLACQLPFGLLSPQPATPTFPVHEATPTVASTPDPGPPSVELLEWNMGSEFDLDAFEVVDPRHTFAPSEDVYILLWVRNDEAAEVPYRAVWRGPDGQTELMEEAQVSRGESGWYLSGNPPPGGWAIGEHTVVLYFGEAEAKRWSFSVDPAAQASGATPTAPQTAQPGPVLSFEDDFSMDEGNWQDCEECRWEGGLLHMGPWPVSGAYLQHVATCLPCSPARYFRMGVDITYEDGPSERGFGLLVSLNDEELVTAEITPWQTVDAYRYDFNKAEWQWINGTFNGAVKPGRQTNRLAVEVTEAQTAGRATVTVNVNGRNVLILYNQPAEPGWVGLTLFGHATEASFDRFEFERLEPFDVPGSSSGST